MSFTELTAKLKQDLLEVAEQTIYYGLESGRYISLTHQECDPLLRRPSASFVSLYRSQQLQGCIGSLRPARPLIEDVAHNTYTAAFRDPHFEPLTAEDFHDVQIEISVLSPLQAIMFEDEQGLLAQLQPNTDGLILQAGDYKATFLPKAWENYPRKQDFLAQLKCKAGLGQDFWSDGLKCYRYTADTFSTKMANFIVGF